MGALPGEADAQQHAVAWVTVVAPRDGVGPEPGTQVYAGVASQAVAGTTRRCFRHVEAGMFLPERALVPCCSLRNN